MVETLNEIAHLRKSEFGRHWPRHGLKLLYWFANECISFDDNNEMQCKCNVTRNEFGFHPFDNRYDLYGDKLLPDVDTPYYVVGNLNYRRSKELPPYVSEDYIINLDDSNTERIIISVDDDDWIENAYVTEHIDNSNYNPDATFRISRGLLMIIRRMNIVEFLFRTGYSTYSPVVPIQLSSGVIKTPASNTAWVPPPNSPPDHQEVDQEPPIARTNETHIQIEPDINTHRKTKASGNAIKTNGFWDMCAIL